MARFNRIPPFSNRPAPSARFAIVGSKAAQSAAAVLPPRPRAMGRRSRPALEIFEERTMLSTIPTFATEYSPLNAPPTIQLSPLQNTVVNGPFAQYDAANTQNQVYLNAGEVYTASVDVQHASTTPFSLFPSSVTLGNQQSGLTVQGPTGTVASASTFSGPMNDLITDQPTNDSEVVFRAPQSGVYTFGAYESPTGATTDAYSLSIRPITLDSSTLNPTLNPADAAKLDYIGGGFYAFLDPAGDTLSLVGPTGRGFDVTGTFSETVTPVAGSDQTTTTITSSGTITIQSGLGAVPIPLPTGFSFQVTTLANGYNGLFGEVNTAQIVFPYQTLVSDLVDPIGGLVNPLVSEVNSDLALVKGEITTPGISLGLGLGGQVNALIPDAPLNPAVPYFYLDAQAGASASLGQVTLSALNYSGAIVIDPADPSLFVEVHGVPVISNFAFAISQNGYIPFQPTVQGTYVSGTPFYGDIYASATLNLADLTADTVPITLSGGTVINFSPAGGSWTSTLSQEAANIIQGNFNPSSLSNFVLGVNVSAGVSLSLEEVAAIEFPLEGASFVYNGPDQALAFSSSTINPFANTPFSFLDGSSFAVQGFVNLQAQQVGLDLTGSLSVYGTQIASGELVLSNNGIFIGGDANVLGLTAVVNGYVNYDGGFYLDGFVYFAASVDATLYGTGYSGSIDAGLEIAFGSNGDLSIGGEGSISGSLWIGYADVWNFSDSGSFGFTINVNSLSPATLFDELVAELA